MLKYDKIDISEGIDVNKTDRSKECMFCHYWYFLNKNFSYGPYTCDGCYDIVQRSTDFKNIAIVHIKKSAYRIYFQHMTKHKAKKIMNKFDLIVKMGNIYCNDKNNKNNKNNKNENENENESENENENEDKNKQKKIF